MKPDDKMQAWSLYWADDRLQSCVATLDQEDQQKLNSIWQAFAKSLNEGAKVLDLATGNGAVPAALLSGQPGLQIDAVDYAEIDPHQTLSEASLVASVNFHAKTDINKLPFSEHHFDAITSQYGIEYAGLESAAAKALKHLAEGGKIALLIHHDDSEIIHSSRAKLAELKRINEPKGLIETMLAVLRGEADFAELESQGQAYLAADFDKSQAISGQVFAGIEQVAQLMQSDPQKARDLGVTLGLRLRSEQQRLSEMDAAAQTETQIQAFSKWLTDSGMDVTSLAPVYIDESSKEYLLGWLVNAEKA
ncbi:MAG: class I SAM-dependent methyltransferase [Pseudomonadota bacterium]